MTPIRPGWRAHRLDELGFVGRGRSRHRPRNDPALYGEPYPFVQTGDIKAADLRLRQFTQTYNETGLAQSKMWEPGTLCITIAANIAETAILAIPACFPDSVIGFVADPKKADAVFIKYYIDFIKLRMQQVSHGTTQDNLSLDKLLRFEFVVPEASVQSKIASILSAYDYLIENNLRRIKILEEIAQTLHREWFVKYRFPGHEKVRMVDSPLGQMPEGWEVRGILECPYFEFIGQSIGPYEGTKIYFATADVDGLRIIGDGVEYTFDGKPSRAQKEPELNSVWFARMQETYKVIAFTSANASLCRSCMLSSGFAGFRSSDEFAFPLLFYTINAQDFHRRKDLFCTGATQRSLTNEGLSRILLAVPPRELVERFAGVVRASIDQILIMFRKIKVLRRTRDLLLPKLICGELDVSELDIAVPEAA